MLILFFLFRFSFVILIILILIKLLFLLFLIYSVNSIYRILRILRLLIQLISYEVVIIFYLIIFISFLGKLEISRFYFILDYSILFYIGIVYLTFWSIRIIIEIIRLPFDLHEGESELISGFRIEFGSLIFLYLILFEYYDIIIAIIFSILYFFRRIIRFYGLFIILFIVLWIRSFFVRFRYDNLIFLIWKLIFPFLLFFWRFFLVIFW